MKEIIVKGIVLSAKDYRDNDKIISVLSEQGVISARLRGVKKNGAKLVFAAQPFVFAEFVLIKSGDFYTCINATCIDQFYNITQDFDSFIFMLACNEICLKSVKENDPQRELTVLLATCLKIVCYEKASPMSVFIKFSLESMRLLGFMMEIKKCVLCSGKNPERKLFSYECNGILCEKCAKGREVLELTPGEYAILKVIDDTPLERLPSCKFLSRDNLISVIKLVIGEFQRLAGFTIESINKFL